MAKLTPKQALDEKNLKPIKTQREKIRISPVKCSRSSLALCTRILHMEIKHVAFSCVLCHTSSVNIKNTWITLTSHFLEKKKARSKNSRSLRRDLVRESDKVLK